MIRPDRGQRGHVVAEQLIHEFAVGNTKVVERVVVDRYATAYPAVGIVLTAQARDFAPAAHAVERGVQPQCEQNARVDCSTPRRSATRLDGIEQPAQILTHDIAPNEPRTMVLSKQRLKIRGAQFDLQTVGQQ